jgi:flagellar biosynthetic protein FlhB
MTMAAPVVVAKGQDEVALNIRKIAREARVPVMENPPLARTLYAACPLDREIPVEFYQAVAEILSLLYERGHWEGMTHGVHER